jgi:phosphoserine aminotransferase
MTTTTTTHRIHNFSAGPAVLPLPVLEEAQRDLVALPQVGMSVMEISHRSKAFEEIIRTAEANLRTLLGVPDNYKVLFLQGGASLQFSMVPMNLLTAGSSADYVITGEWSKKALKEAKRTGGATQVAATTEEGGFKRIPRPEEIKYTPGAA